MTMATNGYRETEIGLIPIDWPLVELGEMADYVNGAAFKPSDWSTSGLPIIRIQNLTGTSDTYNYFDGELAERYRVQTGDLLISWSASLGAFVWKHGEAWLNQHIFKVANISPTVNQDFLYYAVQFYIELLTGQTRGSTMKHIVRKAFLATQLPLPPLPEQRRIAAVLNAIQDAIAAQEDVVAAARAFKRSLMQRLFTYGPGREPAPTKETEIGEIPAHWEVVKLGSLVDLLSGYTFSSEQYIDTIDAPRLLRGDNIAQGTLRWENAKRWAVENTDGLEQYWLQEGDVVLAMDRPWIPAGVKCASVGRADLPSLLVQRVARLRSNGRLNCVLLRQILSGQRFVSYVRSVQTGTSVPHISATQIRDFRVVLPPLAEQEMIADALDAVDECVAVGEDRKTALEALFKSMLHQLMTGQIRLLTDEGLPVGASDVAGGGTTTDLERN